MSEFDCAPDVAATPATAMAPDALAPTVPMAHAQALAARPRLNARQNAMLAEMGLRPWWQAEPGLGAPGNPGNPARPPAAPPKSAAASAAAPKAQAPMTAAPSAAAPTAARQPSALEVPANPGLHAPAPDWDALEQQIRACQRCPLGAQRQCAVPGMGDRRPDWLLVGEAPGEEEDRQGLPFVGRAGQLLDRMLAALQLQRAQRVYIANVIKCRPPQNRNPSADEIAHCTPHLLRQVELLQPKIVLALGRFAAQTLLAEGGCLSPEALRDLPLGKLRGRVYQARLAGRVLPVVVTYHPAYLLRSPADKARAWADLCLAAEALELRSLLRS